MSSKKRVYLTADAAYKPTDAPAQPVPLTQVNEQLANLNVGGVNAVQQAASSPFGTPLNAVPGASPRITDSPNMGKPSNGWSNPQSPAQTSYQSHNSNTPSGSSSSSDVVPISIGPEVQCPHNYFRMTYHTVPQSKTLAAKTSIPYGLVLQPLARPVNQQDVIPVVSPGLCGVVRCRRCRSYINPFVAFVDGGRRWKCNFCYLTNDVSTDYYSPIDQTGRRTDLADRPELQRGVVEFIAPAEYMARPPQPATYFFLIDASFYAISSGMFHMTIETIRRTLDEFPGSPRTRVGFITFNSSLHFYNLRSTLSKPQMMVVTDLSEVFLPIPEDLLVNLVDSRAIVDTLLSKLPAMFPVTQNVDSAYGMALKCAYELMVRCHVIITS